MEVQIDGLEGRAGFRRERAVGPGGRVAVGLQDGGFSRLLDAVLLLAELAEHVRPAWTRPTRRIESRHLEHRSQSRGHRQQPRAAGFPSHRPQPSTAARWINAGRAD
jgi:hypothetical protein